ncbi:hypothetical protein BDN72DRAFT_895208 [Pluteus cervinus]|uniref:Uncharacterized protein n=1 Tax=Pluteus cervinus TaxID=181527 RepID=A0ACD3B2X4_9AGAR|nr:hypothetical protein BDN72DRAFT_895208 [Pluteus cervinus]
MSIGGDQDSDWFSEKLDSIFAYNPPLTDALKRLDNPAQLGSFPFTFYDRHLDEDTRLKHVVLLPSFSADIAQQVDDHLESLRTRSIDHLPMNRETWFSMRSSLPFIQPSMMLTAWDLGVLYASIEREFIELASHWIISPDFPQYKSPLAFIAVPTPHLQDDSDPMLEYSLRFRDYANQPPELLAHFDDSTKDMLHDLQMKELATWMYLPVFPQVADAFKEMDKVATATSFAASTCPTGRIPASKAAPLETKPLVDALITPFDLPRVIAKKGKTKPSMSSKTIRSDSMEGQRTPHFARSTKPTPEGILHHAWRQAVEVDSTFIIMNCGSYERIGFRHRATQTLYLSGLIEVWKCEPSYGKLHLGLQMVIIRDAVDRYKQRVSQGTRKKPDRKRRDRPNTDLPPPRPKSPRVAYHASKSDVVRMQGKNGKAKSDIWTAIDRPCALVNLKYSPFNSPVPAACLRLGQALSPHTKAGKKSYDWQAQFDEAECFTISLNSIFASGSAGFIHAGTIEVIADGQTLRHEVLIKVTIDPDSRKRLSREFSMYQQLWTHKVEGIPSIYGLFEDRDSLATMLVMERAGVAMRERQMGTIADQMVTGVSPGEIANCVSIVEQIHKAGVLHRDLRIDNILFAPDGKLRIIDFDRACLSTSQEDHEREIEDLKAYLGGKSTFREGNFGILRVGPQCAPLAPHPRMSATPDPNEIQEKLREILAYHPPFTDALKRCKNPPQLGSFPFRFYDRHLGEDTRLKHVVLLPSITADLSRQVDDHLEDFQKRSTEPLPLNNETRGYWFSSPVSSAQSMKLTAWELAALYAKIEADFIALTSQWLIAPDYPEYDSALSFVYRYRGFQQSLDDPIVHYSLRFHKHSTQTPELLAEVDDFMNGMLRDLQGKDLAAWIYLPPFPQVKDAFKEMDRIATLSSFPTSSCTTAGLPELDPLLSDLNSPIDALTPPWTLPRVIAKARVKTKSSGSKKVSPDSRTDQRLPDFARSGKPSPEGILHDAWHRAVEIDSTVIVINCGSYERIGIRHRATQTLYLSDLIKVWECEPSYGKLHLGLQMAVIRDVIDRYKQHTRQEPPKKPKKKRKTESTDDGPQRRSQRIAYKTLQSAVARTHGKNDRTAADLWKAIDRPCALVSIRYPPFNSPAPATCLKIGQSLSPRVVDTTSYSWKAQFDLAECFSITLNSLFAGGTAGFIHTGTLEVVTNGQTLCHEVLIKLTTHAHTRKRLRREFSMYKQLWTHKVEGVPDIYGLFEDHDNLATLLIMERAGVSLRHRQTDSAQDDCVDLTPREIADCVSIVEKIHQAGIVHRDLRIDNIVFTPDGKPQIIDFDRARFSTSEDDHKLEIESLKTYLSGAAEFEEWSVTNLEEDTSTDSGRAASNVDQGASNSDQDTTSSEEDEEQTRGWF